MTLQDQVTNLKISKLLKDLGVKQKSLFYWGHQIIGDGNMERDWFLSYEKELGDDFCSAFTVAELGEMLKQRYDKFSSDLSSSTVPIFIGNDEWGWYDKGELRADTVSDTEANARGKMLIYLLENKLI